MCLLRTFYSCFTRVWVCSFLLIMACGQLSAKNFVVTLDAGHGGHDYGALGETTNEKTVTLAVVKQLGALIDKNLKDVTVVYTRDKDVFIPLNERASIANNAKSDLFISIHINSVDKKNKNRAYVEGCQVYTLGLHKTAENLAVAKRENAVMELEPDHTEKYSGFDPNSLESDIAFELSQNKHLDQSIEFADAVHNELTTTAHRVPKGVRQAGFWVLWATSMPSVLVELDFICNPQSEKYLASSDGQEEMVTALYNAFCAYLNTYGSQITGRKLTPATALTVNKKESGSATTVPAASVTEAPAAQSTSETATSATEEPAKSKKSAKQSKSKTETTTTTTTATAATAAKTSATLTEVPTDGKKTLYYVQVLASTTLLEPTSSELKSLQNVEYYKEGGFYKYVVDGTTSVDEAKKQLNIVRERFPEAFIVKMEKGCRVGFIKP